MLKNELIELEINVAYVDEYGDTVNNITYKQVWAEKRSVGCKEFYQASTLGIQPRYVFVINATEWLEPCKRIRYNGKLYDIVRTYEKAEDYFEITVAGDVHVSTQRHS